MSEPGGLVYKYQYDPAGRLAKAFVTDGGAVGTADSTWNHALDVAGDIVLEQTEYKYDTFFSDGTAASLVTHRQRFHDALNTQTGELGTPGSSSPVAKARVSYAAAYFDRSDRPIYDVDYGTNGATAVTSPPAVNTWPSEALVTKYDYRASDTAADTGRLQRLTDPMGRVTKTEYDLLGRVTKTIEAWDGTTAAMPTNATNRTTEYEYNGIDQIRKLKAVLPGTGVYQTTEYVYGVTKTTGQSDLYSNDLLKTVHFPDKTTGDPGTTAADQRTWHYNALGEIRTFKDQNGSVHEYSTTCSGGSSRTASRRSAREWTPPSPGRSPPTPPAGRSPASGATTPRASTSSPASPGPTTVWATK